MTLFTYFALTAILAMFAVGIGITLGESGYGFDLRKRNRRRSKDGRASGRRSGDHVAAA